MKKLVALVLALALLQFGASADVRVLKNVPGAQGDAINAKAAFVFEPVTGRVLFAQNADERLPIASTTKIMTALITLEQPDIDAVFPVDEHAIMVEGSSMGLQRGDKASLRALATGMLLPSGNDAANAAAVRISGSIPAFVGLMNARAKAMGLKDTSFETPSGLDGEAHYSTARELALITREALGNDEFAAICSQFKTRTSYGDPPYDRWLTNHNKLLNYYEGTIGVKTGFTKKAGRCLVSAARRDGVTLICVTLSCPNDWRVHENLYDRFFPQLKVEDLSERIPELCVPVTGGTEANVAAVTFEPAEAPMPDKGADVRIDTTLEPFLYAPVQKGQYVGEVQISLDGAEIYRLTLIADRDVPLLHEYEEPFNLLEWLYKLFDKI